MADVSRHGNQPGAPAGAVHSSRIFRKYFLLVIALVGFVLLASTATSLYYSLRDTAVFIAQVQREKALSAAIRIQGFIRDIDRQLFAKHYDAFDPKA